LARVRPRTLTGWPANRRLICARAEQENKNLDAPDKPTLALLKLMAASDFKAPDDWAGCRELE